MSASFLPPSSPPSLVASHLIASHRIASHSRPVCLTVGRAGGRRERAGGEVHEEPAAALELLHGGRVLQRGDGVGGEEERDAPVHGGEEVDVRGEQRPGPLGPLVQQGQPQAGAPQLPGDLLDELQQPGGQGRGARGTRARTSEETP